MGETRSRYSPEEALESAVALARAAARIHAERDPAAVLRTISQAASTFPGATMGFVGVLEDGATELRPGAWWGGPDDFLAGFRVSAREDAADGPAGVALRTAEPCVMSVSDRRFGTWAVEAERCGLRQAAAFPLTRPDRTPRGVIVEFASRDGVFDEMVVALHSTFAQAASMAVEHASASARLAASGVALDEAVEASRLKSEFLANMSHELRSPLTGILGFSEVLRDELYGPLNDRQKQHVGHIWTSGRRLLDLIEDILDLSRVEAGRSDLDLGETYPRQVAEAVAVLVHQLAFTQGVMVDWEVDPSAEVPVVADARKLKQILFHVLSAAVRLSNSGTVRLSTSVSGGMLRFVVTDAGPGIVADDLGRAFVEFAKVSLRDGTTRVATGVGLALGRRLTEQHGGVISVESRPEGGDTFVVAIPVRPGPG